MNKCKTVKEIVIEYLKEHGYDSLCGDCCSCTIDDLFCCDIGSDCIPGYKIQLRKGCLDERPEYNYIMYSEKITTEKVMQLIDDEIILL